MKSLLIKSIFLLMFFISGCTTIQGVRVKPLDAKRQHSVSFGVGFALNPINWVAWLTDRLTNFNTLPEASDERAKGFRYYLPKTIVKLNPNCVSSDISCKSVDFISIPNTSEEYAVIPQSFLGNYDFNFTMGDTDSNSVTTNHHLLTSVGFKSENSTITNALIMEAGDVGGALITQAIAAPGKATELQQKLLTAKLTRNTLEATLKSTKAKLEECLNQQPVCPEKIALEKEKEDTLTRLETQEEIIAALQKQQNNANSLLDRVIAGESDPSAFGVSKHKVTAEEVYFELIMKDGGLELRPINNFFGNPPELLEKSPQLSIEVNSINKI